MAKGPIELFAGVPIEINVGGSGSLGCFALDEQNKPVLLTCSHVMFSGFRATAGMAVYYPNYSCTGGGDRVATPVFDPKLKATPDKTSEGGYKDGYVDGKWFGGFKEVLGEKWVPAPSTETPWTVRRNELVSETDCAIARLDPGVKYTNALPIIGGQIPIKGVNADVTSVIGPDVGKTPKPEQYVRIVSHNNKGRVMYGTILFDEVENPSSTTVTLDTNTFRPRIVTPIFERGISPAEAGSGAKTSTKHFIILPRPKPIPGESDYTKFYGQHDEILNIQHGDSGSVVIDHQNRVVAMVIFALGFNPYTMLKKPADREKIEFARAGYVGIATPIKTILDHLKMHIPEGQVLSGTVPSTAADGARLLVPGFTPDPALAARMAGMALVRDKLRTTRRGRVILAKIGRHRSEVQHLIATIRPVGAAWRSFSGPAFYHHCLQAITDPTHVIPRSINGRSRARLAEAMLPLLAAHGGGALRRDIERHRRWLLAALDEIERIDDVAAVVARRPS